VEVSSCHQQRFCRAQAGVHGPKHPEGAAFIKQNPDAEQLMYESVLFIGTQFSILYTFMYSPA
jgi:hypothetical protein